MKYTVDFLESHTKYYVVNEASGVWSEAFNTREEAEKELQEETQHLYGQDAKVIEVNEN